MVQRIDEEEKTQYHMMPPIILERLNQIFMMGAKKHGKFTFEKGISQNDLYDACMRHLEAIRKGQFIDPESGFHHGYHAAWNAMMLGYFDDKAHLSSKGAIS